MSVMFKTQQGRTLCNDEMTVDDLDGTVRAYIVGHELGDPNFTVFHVNTRHIVEWWEAE